ncbi:TetR family transcriptional regulator [Microbacterium sp. Sa4CUA7]|uniref:TetR family transcriptional regulator n=1 Tax=Microbacterium pullorum TaxID=2762236 RepID=A0ABR8RYT4_9MICO|nr:TetR family transcriptional regulator [Microbacterium pullorum]MBD7956397.1 TetR family transcriptional regulator [Microbacterium pullorum]
MSDDGGRSAKRPGRPRSASRDDVRAVAMALFEQQGYAATSLAQIARAVGVGRTTLFSYFPAKRDLMWGELDSRTERMRQSLAASTDLPPMEVIVAAILALSHYSAADRAAFTARWRIVDADDELRATVALRRAELSREILDGVHRRAPELDRERVGDVVHALMAIGERATSEWADAAEVSEGLDTYMARRLEPFVVVLRPLLG